MKDNETRNQRGIAKESLAHFRLHRNIGWKFKILGLHKQAAQYQTGDSDQNTCGKNIGGEIEEIPRPISGMNGKEPLEHVDQVDEKIKNKAIKDTSVQQPNNRP